MGRFTEQDARVLAVQSKEHQPTETLMVAPNVWSTLLGAGVLNELNLYLVVNPRLLKSRYKFTDRSPGKLFARAHRPNRGTYEQN